MMSNDLLKEPSFTEIHRILRKRRELRRNSRRLYRELKDLLGTSSSININESFIKWASDNLDMSPFDSLLYLNYGMCDIEFTSKRYEDISNFLSKNNLIYWDEIVEVDPYDRFYSKKEAIRWILAYRFTKDYFKERIRREYKI